MNCESAGQKEEAKTVIRVCVFCETWISGGIESFLCNVWTRMDCSHMEVDIVVSSIGESVFTKPLQECGVRFSGLSGSRWNVAKNHRLFRNLIRKRHYDVFYLNAAHGLSLALLRIARQEGIPIRIAHSHNTALRKSLTRPLKQLVHDLSKKRYTKDATGLWACSRAAAEFMFDQRDLKERGFKFIPNGIDVEKFRFNPEVREKTRKKLELDGYFVIGNVGRLCYQKNQSFLLDIFSEVLKRRPGSRLLLVGEGEERPVLTEKARRLGVLDKVLFYGTADRVEQLLWAMDIFAFPSRFEGLGIAVVEAQAAGLPVICSDMVPDEAHITSHIRSVPLAADAVVWAKAFLKTRGRFPSGADKVRKAGFDIGQVTEQIEDCCRQMCRTSTMSRHLKQVRRQLHLNLISSYKGWRQWRRVMKITGAGEDTAVILLPSCDRKINRLALLYLDDMLKSKGYKDAVILTHDTAVMKCAKLFSENIAELVALGRKDAKYLMQLYCLYEFDKRFIVASLDEPNGRNGSALVGKRNVTIEELFVIGVYHIYPFTRHDLPVYTGADAEIKAFLNQ